MRQRANQSWFSPVRISLIVLVIAVLAVTGLVMYQRQKPSSAKTNAATSQTQTTAQPQSTTTVQPSQVTAHTLDIKEWGVHMTLDSTTASMYYFIKPNLPNVAYLSLNTVSGIAPDCAADKTSLGAISRLTPAEHQAALSDPTKGIAGTVQIGNYWYGFATPQAACISNASESAAVLQKLPGYNLSKMSDAFNTLTAD